MRSVFLGIAVALFCSPVWACGMETDCLVGDRTYRVSVADGLDPTGALFFAHGYRGTAAGVMRNRALRDLATERGWALVALKSREEDWELAHTPKMPTRQEALEYGYVSDVLTDVSARYPSIRTEELILTGFSAGGMFTWTIACGASNAFAGYVPVSGTFWDPVPDRCPTPAASLVHIHGDDDGVVPIEGRPIATTRQGSVTQALALYRSHSGVETLEKRFRVDMVCEGGTNTAGKVLEFCLFEGGHSFSVDRLRYGIDRVLGLAE